MPIKHGPGSFALLFDIYHCVDVTVDNGYTADMIACQLNKSVLTKWLILCRQHFQMNFLKNIQDSDSEFFIQHEICIMKILQTVVCFHKDDNDAS